ncbi:hypothetical protein PIB30_113783 [Stylosanthes scabra]|uniref:CCHC-type domain-containing protein n=2 Tax=Stylosanthes scabra TaxID=79078 RepID=A0ABU6Y0F6_9FABA|nr:hypothetical protein [Stylosanthes scabra]
MLGKTFTEEEIVDKVLWSLTPKWDSKITAIEEGRNFNTLTYDQLRGNLIAYERFNRLAQRKNLNFKNKSRQPPKCYGCGEVGHIKPNCPKAPKEDKEKKFKKKKA